MQHDPALREKLTYVSPLSGERVGLSFIQPQSIDDLVRRRDMVKIWMDATCGMFGRSPDFMNIMITGFASAAAFATISTISCHEVVFMRFRLSCASPTPVKWPWLSMNPGMARRPARSITSVDGPT